MKLSPPTGCLHCTLVAFPQPSLLPMKPVALLYPPSCGDQVLFYRGEGELSYTTSRTSHSESNINSPEIACRLAGGVGFFGWFDTGIRATSHPRLAARDHYTSKHSRWWKRRSRSEFATSHYARGTDGVYMWMQDGWIPSLHGFLRGIEWIVFHGHLDYFQRPPLGGRPDTKPVGDHGSPNVHNCWVILFCYARLRVHGHYTSSILVGGKGGAGPSSRHTMLKGLMEYICECKMDVESTWIPTWHQMDHVSWSLGLFWKTISWR